MLKELNELDGNWDIIDVRFDFRAQAVTWQFGIDSNNRWLLGNRRITITCAHVLSFRHVMADDAMPPWQLDNVTVEEVPANVYISELESQGLKCPEPSLIERWSPFYRLSLQAWEFSATVLCRNVAVGDSKSP